MTSTYSIAAPRYADVSGLYKIVYTVTVSPESFWQTAFARPLRAAIAAWHKEVAKLPVPSPWAGTVGITLTQGNHNNRRNIEISVRSLKFDHTIKREQIEAMFGGREELTSCVNRLVAVTFGEVMAKQLLDEQLAAADELVAEALNAVIDSLRDEALAITQYRDRAAALRTWFCETVKFLLPDILVRTIQDPTIRALTAEMLRIRFEPGTLLDEGRDQLPRWSAPAVAHIRTAVEEGRA